MMEVPSYTIFQEPWWLDAVAPGHWGEAAVKNAGEIIARLPYVVKRRWGITVLTMPYLTPSLGPWYRRSLAKSANSLAEQKDLANELVEQLPNFDLFRQIFSPDVSYWLPYHWAGFQCSVSNTCRLAELSDLDGVWNGFRDNVRTDIRKASKRFTVRPNCDLGEFLRIAPMVFRTKGIPVPTKPELIRRIDDACVQRSCRAILSAVDTAEKVNGVIYLVWDARVVYYLMGSSLPEARTQGVSSLLLWEAIQLAARLGKVFDFEGSSVESVERFFRAFGTQPTTLVVLLKHSHRMRAAQGLLRSLGISRLG
jgi:GNAT superfamily N-acetyltransferase